jgi:hypothetical protein
MLRLGGARVTQFTLCSLSLLSVTTIRRNTIIPPLIVSPSILTVAEIEGNIISCFDTLSCVVDAEFPQSDSNIYHQVIMLDELATEKRVRWDDKNDKFQGTCREHNQKLPLTFTSEHELNLLCDALRDGQVHLASEVCFPSNLAT